MKNNIKKGDVVEVRDTDGGTTRAKVVALDEHDYVEVKWLEARWNLSANVMVARKGTKSTVHKRSIV
jgi:hypothetical protein